MQKILLASLFTLLASTSLAQNAALVVAPTRMVIQPGSRTAEAALTNVSEKTVRYRILLADHIMSASGTTSVSDSFAYSAKPMLRYMPRMVELAPGKRQTVRIMVTRPQGLADGDYHTHMLFEEVAMPVSATTTERAENTVSMRVDMSYSMGIPVVVQSGEISSSVALLSAHLVKDAQGVAQGIEAVFQRSGNAEGNVMLRGTLPGGEKAISDRKVRIYRERDTITSFIPFTPKALEAKPSEVTLELSASESPKAKPFFTQTVR